MAYWRNIANLCRISVLKIHFLISPYISLSFVRVWKTPVGSYIEMVDLELVELFWEEWRGVALLEKICHWDGLWGLKGPFHSQLALSAFYLWTKMWALSYFSSSMPDIMFPIIIILIIIINLLLLLLLLLDFIQLTTRYEGL